MIDTVYKAQGLSLEMLEQSDFNIEGELIAGRIIPVTFTRWAEAKGYEIPDELQKLVETKQSMDSRERTSLLLIINALLIEATYGSNEPHNAAKELVRNMALKDIRVPSERTVAKKIKAARQLHEEETR
ncbi:hypothetical protein BOW50_11395 [Solemya velum gill symbiont]|nr:hypothetical protein BOW50_11395 [Solemya velum gill symbiont]